MLKRACLSVELALLICFSHGLSAHPLTIKRAEAIALKRSSEIKDILAQGNSLEENSIANSQLDDPKLNMAFSNIPTDSFSLTQEPMTQIQLGVEQAFPKGSSLKYKYLSMHHNAQAKKSEASVMNLQIRQKVRLAWLNLAFWLNAKTILHKEQLVFDGLVRVTQSIFYDFRILVK